MPRRVLHSPAGSKPVALVVVVPTRNRASLAMNAVRSVLDQSIGGRTAISILVSDNSTEQLQADLLEDFCRGVADHQVRYIRPPAPLPMPVHWQWAIDYALQLPDATHITYLTDRMVVRPGHMGVLRDLEVLKIETCCERVKFHATSFASSHQ